MFAKMNIWGITPNTQIENKGTNRSVTTGAESSGAAFSQSMGEVVRAAQIEVAGGASSAGLDFWRCKEEKESKFSFSNAEEELMEEYLIRIRKLLKQLQK
jgi:hypothetical protein